MQMRVCRELSGQPGLSDPSLAMQENKTAFTLYHSVDRFFQNVHFFDSVYEPNFLYGYRTGTWNAAALKRRQEELLHTITRIIV